MWQVTSGWWIIGPSATLYYITLYILSVLYYMYHIICTYIICTILHYIYIITLNYNYNKTSRTLQMWTNNWSSKSLTFPLFYIWLLWPLENNAEIFQKQSSVLFSVLMCKQTTSLFLPQGRNLSCSEISWTWAVSSSVTHGTTCYCFAKHKISCYCVFCCHIFAVLSHRQSLLLQEQLVRIHFCMLWESPAYF